MTKDFTPLFGAQHEARYLRRQLIERYQEKHDCRLIVMIDVIHSDSVTYFAELLHDADPDQDLHLLLCSPGGDGEVAVRLARLAQASCRRFCVVIPDIAKSAATILALGAHEIVMGPSSDLGPIDPQIFIPDRGFVSAKEVIAAVNSALSDVESRPNTDQIHAMLLGSGAIDATIFQFAQSALGRADDIALQALSANPDRTPEEAKELAARVTDQLVHDPQMHSAVVGATEAKAMGLPIRELDAQCEEWQEIWRIWTRYFALGGVRMMSIYESRTASQVMRVPSE
ncbi:SDH family Clp fold serine proteinase [Thermomonospora cellulosilytica]|uniref:Membrane-bound ClpP family serine protease n=1 Tax=Thermomonospora cellulosilytica TaxID=1411118 RepID=A0A7W3MUR9_9ACTN|nr:serine dehydrogenase [Thermomonospora cellulosilytica]MBA9002260.1 membrane-bound ClpP family serine protease [Thermomonospora cellulosilytica]